MEYFVTVQREATIMEEAFIYINAEDIEGAIEAAEAAFVGDANWVRMAKVGAGEVYVTDVEIAK